MSAYLVRDSRGQYLGLRGPFCYPAWCTFAVNATPLPMAQAYAWASVVGGNVIPVQDAANIPPAPDTQPSVGLPMPDGFRWPGLG